MKKQDLFDYYISQGYECTDINAAKREINVFNNQLNELKMFSQAWSFGTMQTALRIVESQRALIGTYFRKR